MTNSITRQLQSCFSRLMSCTSSSPFTHHKSLKPDTVLSPSSSPSPGTPSSSALVFHNYNSLYDPAASDSDTQAASNSATFTTTTTATLTPPADPESDPDISSAIASRRLLPPSSPGRSNAIADPSAFAFGIGVAVPTYSPDPYGDFRASMQEMAAAMGMLGPQGTRGGRRRRRERLYELLLCYLALNRKHAHKYIVGAFADLLVAIADDGEEAEEEEEEDDEDDGKEQWRIR